MDYELELRRLYSEIALAKQARLDAAGRIRRAEKQIVELTEKAIKAKEKSLEDRLNDPNLKSWIEGVSSYSVQATRVDRKLPKPDQSATKRKKPNPLSIEQIEKLRQRALEIYEMREGGSTFSKIAKKFDITNTRAAEIYRKHLRGYRHPEKRPK